MNAVVLANGEGSVGVEAARMALLAGRSPLDSVVAGIRVVEADPAVRTVGSNVLGRMALDVSVMCGWKCSKSPAVCNAIMASVLARGSSGNLSERLPDHDA